ncbi:MAG: primosomal protein N' [Candidatus Margulisbacteria bacterium]|nr:primosomal protein N' [Candidatus Margulisiibacteriota bacterium]
MSVDGIVLSSTLMKNDQNQAWVADIWVFRNVPSHYTYLIEDKHENEIVVGCQVVVPLGHGQANGMVLKKYRSIPKQNYKFIKKRLPKKPVISREIIQLVRWVQDTYFLNPHKAFQTVVGTKTKRSLISTSPQATPLIQPYALHPDQQTVIDTILKKNGTEFLLHGITASGKTEVYIQIAIQMIQQNKGVIMLLPEISLTPQFRNILHQRFGNLVSVIHSGLTPKERDIEWNRIYQGHATIVLGPRSAIFAPIQDLGLIIIDEEHETTYKQDQNPRYQVHDIARFRAEENNALLIYGSATPQIETYSQTTVEFGSQLIKCVMSKRVGSHHLPDIRIVDMKENIKGGSSLQFSSELIKEIQHNIDHNEKVILLLNRRGYAPYISCQKCGHIHDCTHCKLSYTYHKNKTFQCHRCDITVPVTNTCTYCKKPSLSFSGTGTQKAELELHALFPGTSILRMDKDTIQHSREYEEKFNAFKSKGAILLGTQLIAKGHHFEDVTLVGILGIDTTLNIPDFRSCERTFQLITQAAGRAGRGKKPGRVIVQTQNPEHYAIQYASQHDYEGFYAQEVAFRKSLWYPPFSDLVHIILSSPSLSDVDAYSKIIVPTLSSWEEVFGDDIKMLGPKAAPVPCIRAHHRKHVLIKCAPSISKDFKSHLKKLPASKKVKVIIDLNPKQIL